DINEAIEEAIAVAPSGPRAATPGGGSPQRAATPPKGATAPRVGTKLGVGPDVTAPAPPVVAGGDPRGRVGVGGGVGIGIPYTGPAGEPIFGLTPEQR